MKNQKKAKVPQKVPQGNLLKTENIGIVNMKGGVGKTGTAVNLAASLAYLGDPTLLSDTDWQADSSAYCGTDPNDPDLDLTVKAWMNKCTLLHAASGQKPIEDCILPTNWKNLSLIASTEKLDDWRNYISSHFALKHLFESEYVRKNFRYNIVDVRPQSGELFTNIMAALDWYIIPVFADALSVAAVRNLFKKVVVPKRDYNQSLKCLGIVITNYDHKSTTQQNAMKHIRKMADDYGITILNPKIPKSSSLSSSCNVSTPLTHYMPYRSLPIRDAYIQLAKKVKADIVSRAKEEHIVPVITEESAIEAYKEISRERRRQGAIAAAHEADTFSNADEAEFDVEAFLD